MAFSNPGVLVSTASASGRTVIAGIRRVGATLTTTRSTAVDANVNGAAITGVPVVSGNAYRASFVVKLVGDGSAITAETQALFKIKNGATQLGTESRSFSILDLNTVDVYMEFDWEAAATETIATINLTMQNLMAGGVITVSVAATGFHGIVEDMGPASTLGF